MLGVSSPVFAKPKELQLHTAEAGEPPGYWLTFSYDGSQHRTEAWGLVPSMALGLTEDIQLGAFLNASSGSGLGWRWDQSLYGGTWISWDFAETGEWAWELEAELSGPSLMSGHGLDLQGSLTAAGAITDEIFAGAALGGVLATAPVEGDHPGYVFATGWVGYATDWITDDHISCGFYAATHETPGYENLLSLEVRYTARPSEDWEITLTIGKEIESPFEHDSFYAGFSFTKSFR